MVAGMLQDMARMEALQDAGAPRNAKHNIHQHKQAILGTGAIYSARWVPVGQGRLLQADLQKMSRQKHAEPDHVTMQKHLCMPDVQQT